ncbi:MAG: hypothetical protein JW810_02495 [Sedimentisphaerales bacterium]|nr:hypothetical protein [Sedimentisphaerales bacterium]
MWCWLYRWRISRALDEAGPERDHRLAGHLKVCEGCRRFYQAHRLLADRLGRQGLGPTDRLAPALRDRILRDLTRGLSESNKRQDRLADYSGRPLRWAAAILLCLSGGLLLWQWAHRTPSVGPEPQPIQGSKKTVSPNPLTAPQWLQGELVGRQTDLSWSGALEQPVLAELENLKADTQSAMDFLLSYVTIDRDRAQKRNI